MKYAIWKRLILVVMGLFVLAAGGCDSANLGGGSSAGSAPTEEVQPPEEEDVEIPVMDIDGNN